MLIIRINASLYGVFIKSACLIKKDKFSKKCINNKCINT